MAVLQEVATLVKHAVEVLRGGVVGGVVKIFFVIVVEVFVVGVLEFFVVDVVGGVVVG